MEICEERIYLKRGFKESNGDISESKYECLGIRNDNEEVWQWRREDRHSELFKSDLWIEIIYIIQANPFWCERYSEEKRGENE